MQSLSGLILFSLLIIFISGCSKEDRESCDATNWYGTYEKVDEECGDPEMSAFEQLFEMKEGINCDNCFSDIARNNYLINNYCQVEDEARLFGEYTMKLDGDIIQVTFNEFDCSVYYRRQG